MQRVALGVGELGRELDQRRFARRGHAVEHLAALGEQGRSSRERRSLAHSLRATKPRWTSPSTERDIAGERHRRVARDVLDRSARSCSESRNSAFICVNDSPSSPSTRNMSGDAVRLTWALSSAEQLGQLLRGCNGCLHARK